MLTLKNMNINQTLLTQYKILKWRRIMILIFKTKWNRGRKTSMKLQKSLSSWEIRWIQTLKKNLKSLSAFKSIFFILFITITKDEVNGRGSNTSSREKYIYQTILDDILPPQYWSCIMDASRSCDIILVISFRNSEDKNPSQKPISRYLSFLLEQGGTANLVQGIHIQSGSSRSDRFQSEPDS